MSLVIPAQFSKARDSIWSQSLSRASIYPSLSTRLHAGEAILL